MLTVRPAAGRAGVGEKFVRSWVAAGRLPHYRLEAAGRRGKILIAETVLDAGRRRTAYGPTREGAGRPQLLPPADVSTPWMCASAEAMFE